MDGVLSTRSGWVGRHEVVEIEYDPERLSYAELAARARSERCATVAFPANAAEKKIARKHFPNALESLAEVRVVKDTKYYLKKSPLQFVPMSEAQASRVNAALATGSFEAAARWLSPRQRRIAKAAKNAPGAGWRSAVGVPLETAWKAAESQMRAKSRPSGGSKRPQGG